MGGRSGQRIDGERTPAPSWITWISNSTCPTTSSALGTHT